MPPFSFKGLRARAIYLVLLAILPLLALTLYSHLEKRERAIHEVQRDELVAARNLASIQQTLISSTRELLMALAQLPQVQRRDREACNALFAEIREHCPYYAALAGGDPEGWVFASAPEAPDPINMSIRHFYQETKRTRDFVVGEPLLGRISKKYSIMLSYPILDDTGRFNGLICVGLDCIGWGVC
jgi:hypothetical protein